MYNYDYWMLKIVKEFGLASFLKVYISKFLDLREKYLELVLRFLIYKRAKELGIKFDTEKIKKLKDYVEQRLEDFIDEFYEVKEEFIAQNIKRRI